MGTSQPFQGLVSLLGVSTDSACKLFFTPWSTDSACILLQAESVDHPTSETKLCNGSEVPTSLRQDDRDSTQLGEDDYWIMGSGERIGSTAGDYNHDGMCVVCVKTLSNTQVEHLLQNDVVRHS